MAVKITASFEERHVSYCNISCRPKVQRTWILCKHCSCGHNLTPLQNPLSILHMALLSLILTAAVSTAPRNSGPCQGTLMLTSSPMTSWLWLWVLGLGLPGAFCLKEAPTLSNKLLLCGLHGKEARCRDSPIYVNMLLPKKTLARNLNSPSSVHSPAARRRCSLAGSPCKLPTSSNASG